MGLYRPDAPGQAGAGAEPHSINSPDPSTPRQASKAQQESIELSGWGCYNRAMGAESTGVLEELPIFPLATVLFPGAILPLHIFEDRYKAMMRYAIENSGQFGLSYRADAEVDKETPLEIGSVGCAAKINAVMPLDENKMNVLSTGLVRYRITELKQTEPFFVARIEPFSDDPEPGADISRLFDDTKEITERYLAALQLLNDARTHDDIELPEEAEAFSLFICSALPVDNDLKQRLLEITSTRLRLTRLRHYLINSMSAINKRLMRHEGAKGNGHGKGLQ
ncbi:MAG TPA: LON peptidase substrate-binding domain-containing protein [Blastocatellia bacterium]|nr:LON peptidase substrate-binding domain-containing protein [Blastocatellia bacterium]